MKSKIETLKPHELLDSYMSAGSKYDEAFKQGHELFYISRLEEVSQISKTPVAPVKALAHTLLYLKEGTLHMKVGSHAVEIHSRECVIIPAGQVFGQSSEEDEKTSPGVGYMCGFHDNFLLGKIGSRELLKSFEFLTVWGNPVIKLGEDEAQHLSHCLGRLMDEYATNGLLNIQLIQSYLIASLSELNMSYQPLSQHRNKRAVEVSRGFKECLHQHIHTTHKVSDYAEMLNISPNHLNKSVKLITQKSPSQWIQLTLVNEAKVLLFQTDLSIQEISYQLGMEDPSYFTRLFKKQEAITPAAYRKMIRFDQSK